MNAVTVNHLILLTILTFFTKTSFSAAKNSVFVSASSGKAAMRLDSISRSVLVPVSSRVRRLCSIPSNSRTLVNIETPYVLRSRSTEMLFEDPICSINVPTATLSYTWGTSSVAMSSRPSGKRFLRNVVFPAHCGPIVYRQIRGEEVLARVSCRVKIHIHQSAMSIESLTMISGGQPAGLFFDVVDIDWELEVRMQCILRFQTEKTPPKIFNLKHSAMLPDTKASSPTSAKMWSARLGEYVANWSVYDGWCVLDRIFWEDGRCCRYLSTFATVNVPHP